MARVSLIAEKDHPELADLIGAYNMHTRVARALRIDTEAASTS